MLRISSPVSKSHQVIAAVGHTHARKVGKEDRRKKCYDAPQQHAFASTNLRRCR